jgi:hypothetical protein
MRIKKESPRTKRSWALGAGVLNGFEKTDLKQPTITHIFIPHQIGTLVFSKIII